MHLLRHPYLLLLLHRCCLVALAVKLDAKSIASQRRFQEPLRFSHIPKTGGSYVERRLKELRLRSYEIWPHSRYYGCTRSHEPHGDDDFTEAGVVGVESFCVVRHPYMRAVSQWSWGAEWTWGSLGYEKTYDGMNAFLQDALWNASNATSFHPDDIFSTCGAMCYQQHTLYSYDCHFVPQWRYVYNSKRDRTVIDTVMRFEALDAELEKLFAKHRLVGAPSGARQRRQAFTYNTGDSHRWALGLSAKTLEYLDVFYAVDFDVFEFPKEHNITELLETYK